MPLILQGAAELQRKLKDVLPKHAKTAMRKGCRAGAKMAADAIRDALPESVIGQTRHESRTDWGRIQAGVEKAAGRLSKAKTEKGMASARLAAAKIMAKATMGALRQSVKVAAIKRNRRGRIGSRVVVDAKTPQGVPYGQFGEYGTKHEAAKHWERQAVRQAGDVTLNRCGEIAAAELEKLAGR